MLLYPLERCPTGLRVSTYRFESCLGQLSSALTTHLYNSASIRVVTIDGNPWFVAADVCECLGLQRSKSNGSLQDHMRRLDTAEYSTAVVPMSQNHRKQYLISESGLYKLIMRSDKPEAKAFQDWVTKEVLPI